MNTKEWNKVEIYYNLEEDLYCAKYCGKELTAYGKTVNEAIDKLKDMANTKAGFDSRAGKSLYQISKEAKEKHGTNSNTFDDFPVGTRVKVIVPCQDFNFFFDETGTVIENKGHYLGIAVAFDTPREFEDGSIQTRFNFEPCDLLKIS